MRHERKHNDCPSVAYWLILNEAIGATVAFWAVRAKDVPAVRTCRADPEKV
jgi:hypothetical protein